MQKLKIIKILRMHFIEAFFVAIDLYHVSQLHCVSHIKICKAFEQEIKVSRFSYMITNVMTSAVPGWAGGI